MPSLELEKRKELFSCHCLAKKPTFCDESCGWVFPQNSLWVHLQSIWGNICFPLPGSAPAWSWRTKGLECCPVIEHKHTYRRGVLRLTSDQAKGEKGFSHQNLSSGNFLLGLLFILTLSLTCLGIQCALLWTSCSFTNSKFSPSTIKPKHAELS